MTNLLRLLTTLSLVLGMVSPSLANSDTTRTEKQFQGDSVPNKCPRQKRKQGDFIYLLCQVKGKPVYLEIREQAGVKTSPEDEGGTLDVAIFEYKNGQLIRVVADDFQRYGFRNNKLVAAWHLDKTITNLSLPKYRAEEKRLLTESRKILRLYGIKQK
ncbi:MAG: hypothetical protein HC903_32205 [Methylacidiphilales bacterium]|nr:hypothetical protein [Candidatus Methylacidiphilales bacterium]NJR17291.1 hypothetical protein [Calothrix sp. CSU_2_0]